MQFVRDRYKQPELPGSASPGKERSEQETHGVTISLAQGLRDFLGAQRPSEAHRPP